MCSFHFPSQAPRMPHSCPRASSSHNGLIRSRVPPPARCPMSAALLPAQKGLVHHTRGCRGPFFQLEAHLCPLCHLNTFSRTVPQSFFLPVSPLLPYILLLPHLPVIPYPSSKDRWILSCPPEYYLHEMKCDSISMAWQGCFVPYAFQRW